jgi:hypothetical protein
VKRSRTERNGNINDVPPPCPGRARFRRRMLGHASVGDRLFCHRRTSQMMEEGRSCPRCQGAGWVCENHPDRPWGHDHDCSRAGMPCPDCNEPHEGERPTIGDDFIPAFDRDKGPVH